MPSTNNNFCPSAATMAEHALPRQQPTMRREPSLSEYVQTGNRKDPPDRRKYCDFQVNVMKAARDVALFGLLLALFRLLCWALDPSSDDLDCLGPLLHNLAMLGAHGLLWCAVVLRAAPLCLPFLLVNPVSLYLLLRFMASLFAVLAEWPLLDTIVGMGPLAERMEPEDRQLASVAIRLTLLWLLAISVTTILLCWLQWVIFRAFILLRQAAKEQAVREDYRSFYSLDPRTTGRKQYF